MEFAVIAAVSCVIVCLFLRRNRERAGNRGRAGNAPLRNDIEARVSFQTHLYRASVLGTGGFGGTRGAWISLRGSKRLIVGTDAFMVSASSATQPLREYVFIGRESSIALSQAPSRVIDRDWIVITGQAGGRQVWLAITRNNLPEVWQALAGTGVTLVSAPGELEQLGKWRRFAMIFVFVILFTFIPTLVSFIAHHLR
jgi:hypothetical protein